MKNCWYRQRHSWPLRTENQTLPKILTARMKQQITKWSACGSYAEVLPFQSGLRYRHDGPRKSNPNVTHHLPLDTLPPGRTQAGHA